jgi:hypothetical protein
MFDVSAKNYGNRLSQGKVLIEKLGRPAPAVLLDGPYVQHTMHDEEWVGRVFAKLPVLTCVPETLSPT